MDVTKNATLTQNYVEYQRSDRIGSLTYSKAVKKRATDDALRDIKTDMGSRPADIIRFRFFDKTEIDVKGETLRGDAKNYSGWYYPNAKLMKHNEFHEYAAALGGGVWGLLEGSQLDRSKELMVAVVHLNRVAYYLGIGDSVLESSVEQLARKD
jgi:hypothetical protein